MNTNEKTRTIDLAERAEKELKAKIDEYIGYYGSEDVYSREIGPVVDGYLQYCDVLDEIESLVSECGINQEELSRQIVDKITYARQTADARSKDSLRFHFGMVRELITGLALYHAKIKGF
ncbi:hypothetical protein ACTJIV_15625 [Chryseobacterium sp. 22532]|uniref:hypothetical protein n=1 Tax=Chryseobacterium sp. 22532 TaxID=3453938 RepID=UPI003F879E4A